MNLTAMTSTSDDLNPYFDGQLLIAMPGMADERFHKAVIYICAHNEDGAMGLILNQVLKGLSFPGLLEQLAIEEGAARDDVQIHCGGPVEAGRGFVLHSDEYQQDATLLVKDGVSLTATNVNSCSCSCSGFFFFSFPFLSFFSFIPLSTTLLPF